MAKYVAYQHRWFLEAIKTKAMLQAMLGQEEGAAESAEKYFDSAIPVLKQDREALQAAMEAKMRQLEEAGPLMVRKGFDPGDIGMTDDGVLGSMR